MSDIINQPNFAQHFKRYYTEPESHGISPAIASSRGISRVSGEEQRQSRDWEEGEETTRPSATGRDHDAKIGGTTIQPSGPVSSVRLAGL